MWASFVAIFQKEFLHIIRDRGTLILAFTIPLFQLTLFGFIDQTVKNVATVVVDQDRSSDSRELIDRIRATGTFRISRTTENVREAREEIIAARARVGIVIPPDYHGQRARGTDAKILALIDGSGSTVTAQALAAINALVAQTNLEEIERKTPDVKEPIAAQPIILFNPDGRTPNFIIPGLVAILLQMVAMVLAAVAIVRERERGTLEQLLVTPINPLGLILGKLGPYLCLGILEMALILLAMNLGFSVPIRGSLVFLFLIALVYLFCLLALGLFVSTRTHSQSEAQQLALLFLMPSIFLSGYIFPVEGLPFVLRNLGRLLPATHMIAVMRGVVLRDAGPKELFPHVLALIGLSVVLLWFSVRSFRRIAT